MKRIIALVLAMMMVLLAFASCTKNTNNDTGTTPDADGEKVVKIGIFEPASGNNGAGGKKETLGIKYANQVAPTVDINGETYKVELVEVDNQSDDAKGITAAADLVGKGVSVVLGSYGSSVSIAASPTFADAGLAVIGVTCTNELVTKGNDHYFRVCFLDPFQGAVLANRAWDLGATKAYTLAEVGNAYDQGLASSFKTAFEALGGEIVAANFPNGTADFTSYITTAVTEGCGVIFAPTSINYAQLIIQAAIAQNVEIPLMAGDTWDDNSILAAAKGSNVKIEVTTFYQEGGNPEFDAGFKGWLANNAQAMTDNGDNDIVSAVTAMGYDAYFTALEAIKAAASTDRAAIKAALPAVQYEGITGLIKFDEIGDAERDIAYIKTANNETGLWEFVKEQGIN